MPQPSAKPPKPPKKPSTPERREMHTKLGLLTIAVIIALLGFSIVIPLMPYFVTGALHETGSPLALKDPRIALYSGWLIAIYALMQFFFAPIWGWLSDRVGRKPILMMSLIGDVVFYAMFGLVKDHLHLLFAARILAGIVSSGTLSVAQAYVADVTPPEERAVGLGMLGAAFGIGFVFGPALGGWLGTISLSFPMYLASFLALVNAVYVWRYVPESRKPGQPERAGGPSVFNRLAVMAHSLAGPVGGVYLLTFLVTFAFANLEGSFSAYLALHFGYNKQLAASANGLAFTFIGVLIVIVQGGLIRPLKARYSEITLVFAGLALMVVGFFLFPMPHKLLWLILGPIVPVSLGNGLNGPSLRSLISRASSADAQGSAMGIASSFDSLARFAGPATGGWLLADYGPRTTYWFVAVLMAAALLLAAAVRAKLPVPEVAAPIAGEPVAADA